MLIHEFRQALRVFSQKPVLSLVVVLILSLGVGGTTTIFSIVSSALLEPLPYKDGEQLVVLMMRATLDDSPQTVSYLDALSWREQSTLIEEIAASSQGSQLNMTGGSEAERVGVGFISASYFDLLGVTPFMGRNFLPEEEDRLAANAVVILTYPLWRDRFGSDPQILNKSLRLHDHSYTVVGILPKDFQDIHEGLDLYVPVTMARITHRPGYVDDRRARWLTVFGRLASGVTLDQARQEMSSIVSRLAEDFPDSNHGYEASLRPLRTSQFNFEQMRLSIMILLVGATLILVIGCANVSNLLLLRAVGRRKEIALYLALGASSQRLTLRFLLESLVLSLTGGLLGIAASFFVLKLMIELADRSFNLPDFINIAVDGRALAAALGLSVVAGLTVGLIPALKGMKVSIQEELHQSGRSQAASGSSLALNLLTVSAIFFSVVPLVGAGLMLKSLRTLKTSTPGFTIENVLTARMELPSQRYPEEEMSFNVYRSVMEGTGSLPGVESSGIWAPGIPGYSYFYKTITPEGRPIESVEDKVRVFEHRISPGLLGDLGVAILKGRDFTEMDDASHPKVGIVSQSTAETLWPGQDAIGKRFWVGRPQEVWIEVVGIVNDMAQRGRLAPVSSFSRDVYFPLLQMRARNSTIILKSSGDLVSYIPKLRGIMQSIDPDVPVYDIQTMEERRSAEEQSTRLTAFLLTVFAAIAFFLAITGVYTVLAYTVRQRYHEIGVRMALGAERSQIFQRFLNKGMVMVFVGLAVGLLGAFMTSKVLASVLFGVDTNDPLIFATIAILVLVVAFFACVKPAQNAMKIDPSSLLRQ